MARCVRQEPPELIATEETLRVEEGDIFSLTEEEKKNLIQ
jgi:hypothetical protein